MLEENKNSQNSIKDNQSPSPLLRGGLGRSDSEESSDSKRRGAESTPALSLSLGGKDKSIVSYTKTNKLISALYMVTDLMDINEPMKFQLRTLGISILSDISLGSKIKLQKDIYDILNLLDIASVVQIISEMNLSILRKEFNELKSSIQKDKNEDNDNWLKEFLEEENLLENKLDPYPTSPLIRGRSKEGVSVSLKTQPTSIGRIGVQKGSTLLKALSQIKQSRGIENTKMSDRNSFTEKSTPRDINKMGSAVRSISEGWDNLKRQRRELVLKIIKAQNMSDNTGASIKDIMQGLKNNGQAWGEKTLQRELVSMTQDGVLNKTGEKRWSRYSIN